VRDMSDAPKPSSWPHAFVVACISLFVGVIALQLTMSVLRSIMPELVTSGLLIVLVAAVVAWRRQNRREPW
jgi:protein-S-isoprenylcysteine O-methyltransferase Ste14